MSARLATLAMLTGSLLPALAAACPPGGNCVSQRNAERRTAILVRTSLYAVCGLPAALVLDHLGACQELAEATERDDAEPMPSCPYLREQGQRKTDAVAPSQPVSVLENLEKIEKADQIYRKAERLRNRGEEAKARQLYEQVRDLCPGSACDQKAGARLEEMDAAEAAEEQELQTPDVNEGAAIAPTDSERINQLLERCQSAVKSGDYARAEHLMLKATWRLHQLQRTVGPNRTSADEAQEEVRGRWKNVSGVVRECFVSAPIESKQAAVEELLVACHKAIAAGCLDQAQQLARKALALDPVQVAADALIFKTHMLIQLQEKAREQQCAPEDRPDAEATYPGCVAAPPGAGTIISQPVLPPIGPLGNRCLDELELRVAEPLLSQLDIFLEEPCEQAAAPRVEGESKIASFYLPTEKLVLKVDGLLNGLCPGISWEFGTDWVEEAEASSEPPLASAFGSLSAIFEAYEALRMDCAGLDIDCGPLGGEFRCGLVWKGDAVGFRWEYNPSGRGGLRFELTVPYQQLLDWFGWTEETSCIGVVTVPVPGI